MELVESFKVTAKGEISEETGLAITDLQLIGIFSRLDYYLIVMKFTL